MRRIAIVTAAAAATVCLAAGPALAAGTLEASGTLSCRSSQTGVIQVAFAGGVYVKSPGTTSYRYYSGPSSNGLISQAGVAGGGYWRVYTAANGALDARDTRAYCVNGV